MTYLWPHPSLINPERGPRASTTEWDEDPTWPFLSPLPPPSSPAKPLLRFRVRGRMGLGGGGETYSIRYIAHIGWVGEITHHEGHFKACIKHRQWFARNAQSPGRIIIRIIHEDRLGCLSPYQAVSGRIPFPLELLQYRGRGVEKGEGMTKKKAGAPQQVKMGEMS